MNTKGELLFIIDIFLQLRDEFSFEALQRYSRWDLIQEQSNGEIICERIWNRFRHYRNPRE